MSNETPYAAIWVIGLLVGAALVGCIVGAVSTLHKEYGVGENPFGLYMTGVIMLAVAAICGLAVCAHSDGKEGRG